MKPIVAPLLAVLAIAAALSVVTLSEFQAAIELVKNMGVACMWVILGLLIYGLTRAIPKLREEQWWDKRGVIIAMTLSVFMHLHYPHQFKILADELVLVGVSKAIHEERQIATPQALQDASGAVKISQGYVDKRPFFYPFVLSLLHDATGYRPANALILNALLTPVLLYLVFLVAWRVSGSAPPGWVAMLMVAAVPIFAHNVTGGGFEILNICMILALFLWAWTYAQTGSSELQIGFIALAILTAYTRYESVLYLVASVGVVLLVAVRNRRLELSPLVALSPVLVIPLGCIFRMVFFGHGDWSQLADTGAKEPFSSAAFVKNIPHALAFFFADDHVQMGSRWISAACTLGVPFGLIAWTRALRLRPAGFSYHAPALLVATLLGNFVILLSYHWGQLDDFVVSRLAIPFIVFGIVATVGATQCMGRYYRHALIALAAIGAFSAYAVVIPTAAKHSFGRAYGAGRELETIQEFVKLYHHPDTLVLTDRPIYWVCYGIWTEDIRGAVAGRKLVESWVRNGHYARIYVQQRLIVDKSTGELMIKHGSEVPKEWTLEEVLRRRLTDGEIMVISQILTAPPARPDSPDGPPGSTKSVVAAKPAEQMIGLPHPTNPVEW